MVLFCRHSFYLKSGTLLFIFEFYFFIHVYENKVFTKMQRKFEKLFSLFFFSLCFVTFLFLSFSSCNSPFQHAIMLICSPFMARRRKMQQTFRAKNVWDFFPAKTDSSCVRGPAWLASSRADWADCFDARRTPNTPKLLAAYKRQVM